MSKSSIGINISGGSSTIGNITQGNNGRSAATTSNQNTETDRLFSNFLDKINNYETKNDFDRLEIADLRNAVEELRFKINNQNRSEPKSIGKIAKNLHETYGWAAKPLKELFDTVVPGWMA